MHDTTKRRTSQRGVSLLESTMAGAMFLVLAFGTLTAADAFTDAAEDGRKHLKGMSRSRQAVQGVGRALSNATILDPTDDIQVLTAAGVRVADSANGQPIKATGPILVISKKSNFKVKKGEVVYDKGATVFKMDDAANDYNQDGRTDQLLRAWTDKGKWQYQVLANNVLGASFTKHGPIVHITCECRGPVKTYDVIQGKKIPVYSKVVQKLVARPRNF